MFRLDGKGLSFEKSKHVLAYQRLEVCQLVMLVARQQLGSCIGGIVDEAQVPLLVFLDEYKMRKSM